MIGRADAWVAGEEVLGEMRPSFVSVVIEAELFVRAAARVADMVKGRVEVSAEGKRDGADEGVESEWKSLIFAIVEDKVALISSM